MRMLTAGVFKMISGCPDEEKLRLLSEANISSRSGNVQGAMFLSIAINKLTQRLHVSHDLSSHLVDLFEGDVSSSLPETRRRTEETFSKSSNCVSIVNI